MSRLARPFTLSLVVLALAIPIGISAASPETKPTSEDATRAAEQEMKNMPAGYVQIRCTPSLETFPPYTRTTGVPGMPAPLVLADGRCFGDPAVDYTKPLPAADDTLIIR